MFADALVREPQLRLIAVIPRFPDQDGRVSSPPNLLGRASALRLLQAAAGPRVAVYCLENAAGTPIYVHAKACVIDDTWACVGSDNANRRSWTHDSELSCAVLDTGVGAGGAAAGGAPAGGTPAGGAPAGSELTEGGSWARALRLELSAEHLGGAVPAADLVDPVRAFDAFRHSAAQLDAWHESGARGRRPPGQLRLYTQPQLSRWTRTWATPMYRLLYDPDGRRPRMRHARRY